MIKPTPNAEVEYVDTSGAVVAIDRFRDPGLDENSPMAKDQKERGVWRGPHLAYGCGRKLILAAALCGSLVACDQFKQMTGQTVAGVAGGATVAAVTPEARERIAGLCRMGGAALDAAAQVTAIPGSARGVLKETAVYGDAYCDPVLAGLPLPATTDKNTVSWLQTIIDALPSLARTAQIVLPAIMGR